MSNVDIAYSDSDFYKNSSVCDSTNSTNSIDLQNECTINSERANILMNIAKTHTVSNERLYNMQNNYNNTILFTINLGIGIVITGSYILYKITKLK
jgi:hypothetical protein